MKKYYYDIKDDLSAYPEAWAVLAWSGRNTGKTYSILKYMLESGSRFVYVKRTVEDVKLILSGSGKIGSKLSQYGADLSPFKAVNRDTGSNVRAFGIYSGYLGGFWTCTPDNEAIGEPVGYLTSLNAVSKVKGFDLSDCDYLIFDEFIPTAWERSDRNEGKQLLDLYMTISRDREHRGKAPLKLICLANPTEVNCPVMQEMEVADDAAEMVARGEEYRYTRGILLHYIIMRSDFTERESKMPALKAMQGTAWRDAALGEGFAYNDLGMIRPQSLKGYRCEVEILYRRYKWYIYRKDALIYVCKSPGRPLLGSYDLNRDADARRFYLEYDIDLKTEYISGNVNFQTYTMCDVLINYRKFFPKI